MVNSYQLRDNNNYESLKNNIFQTGNIIIQSFGRDPLAVINREGTSRSLLYTSKTYASELLENRK